jgi:alpha-glucuronidase
MASLGINAVCINNVNASSGNNGQILTAPYLAKVAALADIYRAYGVRLYLSIDFNSPRSLGGLETADPLDKGVRKWWHDKADEIYRLIPDFGGFLVKADSEGQAGPFAYGRDHADGANMLAQALAGHGGTLIWRAFVYGGKPGGDRAASAYDAFIPLDGRFAANAMLQIKDGPLDFQVREPVHPLLTAMPKTQEVLELQITQEYTGQSTDICYLVPAWKRTLDFDRHEVTTTTRPDADTVAKHIRGIAGVVNVGLDRDWMGQQLAMANFYGFGRLAWDPSLSSRQIAVEWTRQTFGVDQQVVKTVSSILLDSCRAYENYTTPLGLVVLHDFRTHFNPAPGSRVAYHHANKETVGFDRTAATGSGYTRQYPPAIAAQYESLKTCPLDLLLFFHAVRYDHRLQNGKTLIQTLYDRYYSGVDLVHDMRRRWMELQPRIDSERHAAVLAKLDEQIRHATLWRDTMTRFFMKMSGIPDQHGRLRVQGGGAIPASRPATAG